MSDSTEAVFVALADGLGEALTFWEELPEDDQDMVVAEVTAAWEDAGGVEAGTEEESEFQRMGRKWKLVGRALQAAAPVAGPAGVVLLPLGTAFVNMSRVSNLLDVERTTKLAAWLASTMPGPYGTLCRNPWMMMGVALVSPSAAAGVAFDLAKGETFYLLSSCPAFDAPRPVEVPGVTMDPLGSGSPTLADVLAGAPSTVGSGSSSSNALLIGAAAVAAVLYFGSR